MTLLLKLELLGEIQNLVFLNLNSFNLFKSRISIS